VKRGIAASDGHIAPTPDGRCVWRIGGMFNNGVKSKIKGKFPHFHFLHHKSTWIILGLNPGQRDENPWAAWVWHNLSSSLLLVIKLPAEMDFIFMESFRVPEFLKFFIIVAVVKLQLLRIIHTCVLCMCICTCMGGGLLPCILCKLKEVGLHHLLD
jgi:hypothetical protein